MTMNKAKLPRLLIGASGSGCGKTTFTCGLLRALADAGKKPVSFKCGPDYIDPMFHTEVLNIPSRNLDLFFAEENTVRYLMHRHGAAADIAVIEGVMGYYDGLAGISAEASSWDLARVSDTPAILLLDGRGKSVSLLAEIKGFLELEKDSHIRGVILNRISGMIYPELKERIESTLPVRVYGYLPKMENCSLESRHLGLVTAKEVRDLQAVIGTLARQIRKTVDLEGLIRLAEQAGLLCWQKPRLPEPLDEPVRIGVANDNAFCFYYADNLELLRELGAEILFFSPVSDNGLPERLSGLLLGGGYPELYLPRLSSNASMRGQIKAAIEDGMPCFAECGGFMYLHETLKDREGTAWPMAGVIPGESYPTDRLGRFGYITLTSRKNTLLGPEGQVLRGHEFHYWDSACPGDAFHAKKPLRKREWECINAEKNLFAGYPHIYFYSNPQAAKNFVQACLSYKNRNWTQFYGGRLEMKIWE